MRGGTSRALFFRREDLPADIAAQDHILLAALGNPDPSGRLVNGLGGPISSTSKAAIISARPGEVKADFLATGAERLYLSATVYRTARRIMDGYIYLPEELLHHR